MPPPGAGFVTVTATEPLLAGSVLGIDRVIVEPPTSEAGTTVTASAGVVPVNVTVDDVVKLLPVITSGALLPSV